MPQAIIYLDDLHDDKVNKYSKKWNISKHQTILKMIEDFKEKKE